LHRSSGLASGETPAEAAHFLSSSTLALQRRGEGRRGEGRRGADQGGQENNEKE
jgi:hypothetical protein